jgi:hypothetical protein
MLPCRYGQSKNPRGREKRIAKARFGGTLCKPFRDLKLAACDSSWCGKLLRIVAPHSALLQGIGLNEFFPLGKFRESKQLTVQNGKLPAKLEEPNS